MAKTCQITGKKSIMGGGYSNRTRATQFNPTGMNRKYPNLQSKKIFVPELGKSVKITVSDNGVFTTFSLSDKIAEPFSEAVILTQMLVARQMNASNHDTVGDYPAQHAGNLPIVDRS